MIKGIEPVPYNELDAIEHELKFVIDQDCDQKAILDFAFSPYGKIQKFRTSSVEDIYLDTSDYCLAKHGAFFRLREGWKKNKITINFKFPGEQRDGVFARREVRSRFKPGPIDINRALDVSCEASLAAISFFKTYAPTGSDPQEVSCRLRVTTRRVLYALFGGDDEWEECGIIFFDTSTYHRSTSPQEKREDFELEFEISSDLISRRTLDLLDEINNRLLSFGLLPSRKNKYARGLELFGVDVSSKSST
ncbi:MAG: hypothetical protein OXI63_26310 [Candidatus Poribacteria bacterium]|nr:hypothetical protein [Candidatus Poribacteria bacterium]